jgi:hypothetical protein
LVAMVTMEHKQCHFYPTVNYMQWLP